MDILWRVEESGDKDYTSLVTANLLYIKKNIQVYSTRVVCLALLYKFVGLLPILSLLYSGTVTLI